MAHRSNHTASELIPEISEEGKPYWEGCLAGELRMQTCNHCKNQQWFPRLQCKTCGSSDFSWKAISGRGVIYSYTVVHRAMAAAFKVPYVFALVDLDDGPRMVTNIVEVSENDIRIGQKVEVVFEQMVDQDGKTVALPKFRPVKT